MRLRVFTEPQQGASYDDLLAVARCAEDEGFDAFFRSDHYLKMGDIGGRPGPTDAWTTLAGLARETTRIRLGTLVTLGHVPPARAAGHHGGPGRRHERRAGGARPRCRLVRGRAQGLRDPLSADTGSASSGSRSSWPSSPGCGPMPPATFRYDGTHYQLSDSPALPKPVQRPHPPIIVGGGGAKRTPRLAARFADEYNTPVPRPSRRRRPVRRVREPASGRAGPCHPRVHSAAVVCCGADEAEVARRAKAIGREVDELRANGVCGTPAEADRAARGVGRGRGRRRPTSRCWT